MRVSFVIAGGDDRRPHFDHLQESQRAVATVVMTCLCNIARQFTGLTAIVFHEYCLRSRVQISSEHHSSIAVVEP